MRGWYRTRDFPDEICAISCQPYDPSKNYASAIAVSFWGSNRVEVLALDSKPALQAVCDVILPTLPRSVLLHNFGTGTRPRDPELHPYLLVGLADGTLVTYALKDGTLHNRKQSSLGNAPASLSVCTIDGKTVVLASGTRSSILFLDRQRVRPSPVSVKVSSTPLHSRQGWLTRRSPEQDMIRGVTLNTAMFPSCLAIATSSSLLIGNVRGLDKMQIRSVRVPPQVRALSACDLLMCVLDIARSGRPAETRVSRRAGRAWGSVHTQGPKQDRRLRAANGLLQIAGRALFPT